MQESRIGMQQVGSKNNPITRFQPPEWYWTREGGDFRNHRDFFAIHWEVHHPPLELHVAHFVRLHVECPQFTVDSLLNGIKEDLVMDLWVPSIKQAVLRAGYEYKIGPKRSQQSIRQQQSTEVFRVLLPEVRWEEKPEDNLMLVDGSLRAQVEEVVARLRPVLDGEFGG